MRADPLNAIIVEAGACGGLAARELAPGGMSVVAVEAGKRLDPAVDLRNSAMGIARRAAQNIVATGQHQQRSGRWAC